MTDDPHPHLRRIMQEHDRVASSPSWKDTASTKRLHYKPDTPGERAGRLTAIAAVSIVALIFLSLAIWALIEIWKEILT